MEQFEIRATVRLSTGNSPARVLRRGGQMPAVLYGRNTEPILLSVNIKDLEKILKKGQLLDKRFIELNRDTYYQSELELENANRDLPVTLLYDRLSRER